MTAYWSRCPWAEILTRLNPALITRRRVQKQVEIPAEICSPFDQRNQGLIFSVGPTKPESAPPPALRSTRMLRLPRQHRSRRLPAAGSPSRPRRRRPARRRSVAPRDDLPLRVPLRDLSSHHRRPLPPPAAPLRRLQATRSDSESAAGQSDLPGRRLAGSRAPGTRPIESGGCQSGVADRSRRARAQAGPRRFYLEDPAFLDQARAPAGGVRP